MRIHHTATRVAALTCALGLCACRKKADQPPPPRAAAAAPDSDTNFTAPEIRRPEPSDTSLVPPTTQVQPAPQPAVPAPPAAAPTVPPQAKAPPPARTPPPPPPPPVPTQAPQPSAPAAEAAEPGSEGDWVLQVNVHKSESEAQAQVDRLGGQGIPAYVVAVPANGLAGRYWRVRVGRFRTRAQAQAYGDSRIIPKGLKFWIDRKSNESRPVGGA